MALAIIVLGAFVIAEAVTSLADPGYAQVGPGVFPVIIGVALTLIGVGLLLEGLRGRWQVVWFERDPSPAHSRERMTIAPLVNVLLVAVALTFNVVLFASLGFVIASAVLFACVAAAFGSRRFVLDAALGLAFGGAIYLVFVHGLGLHLPPGAIWEGFPWMR